MKNGKQTEINRKSLCALVSKIIELREDSGDIAVKRRLRALEERLSVSSPTDSKEAEELDAELAELISRFRSVLIEGVLTERYLQRMELLVSRRVSLC